MEGHGKLLPSKNCRCRIWLDVIEDIGQHLKGFCGVRFHVHAQGILFFVVAETAPGSRVFRENHGPLIFVRDGVQAIGAGCQGFPFHGNIARNSDGGILVRARSPYFPVRHGLAPDLPPADCRPVIRDRDICQSDPLGHRAALADTRNVQLRRLASVLELRAGIPCQNAESHDQAQSKLPHLAHRPISSPKETLR